MTETQYVDAINLERVNMALTALRLMTPVNVGDEIYDKEIKLMILTLTHWKNELKERIITVEG
jgi:hypothetical protein